MNIKSYQIFDLQHPDLNAQQIQSVQIILHAYKKNVKIPALPLLVELMLNVGLLGIALYASASQVMKVTHIASVKNVSLLIFVVKGVRFYHVFLFNI